MTRASLATVYPSILTSHFRAQWWVLVSGGLGGGWGLGGDPGSPGWAQWGYGAWGGARGAMGPWLACVWVLSALAGSPGALVGLCGGAWLWVLGPDWPEWGWGCLGWFGRGYGVSGPGWPVSGA